MDHLMASRPGAASDDHLRAAQFFRGAVSTKMVASPQALRSLESVDLKDLPKGERELTHGLHQDIFGCSIADWFRRM